MFDEEVTDRDILDFGGVGDVRSTTGEGMAFGGGKADAMGAIAFPVSTSLRLVVDAVDRGVRATSLLLPPDAALATSGRLRRGTSETDGSGVKVTLLAAAFEIVDDALDPALEAELLCSLGFFWTCPFSAMVSKTILVLSSFFKACLRGMSLPYLETVE